MCVRTQFWGEGITSPSLLGQRVVFSLLICMNKLSFYKQQQKTNFQNKLIGLAIDYLLYYMNTILVFWIKHSLSTRACTHTHTHTHTLCAMAVCSQHIITPSLTFQYGGVVQGVGASPHLHLDRPLSHDAA